MAILSIITDLSEIIDLSELKEEIIGEIIGCALLIVVGIGFAIYYFIRNKE